ncbi:MAG TPA: adenosine deaminase [Gemmatimonadaceae bacterium]|nr:adenosine deaminase [Gemmatimonadaceae bacterium]
MATRPTREQLRRLPKAELHCHLDGSLRPETLLELSRARGLTLPVADAEALARFMVAGDILDLEEYLRRFEFTLGVMQDAEALERIANELLLDASSDGIRYLELRYAPALNTAEGLRMHEAVEAALRGIARAQRETAIVGRVILCAIRTMPPAISLETAEVAVAFKDLGVVGFDLAGAEHGNAAAVHAEAFLYAREHELACTVHAGEADGPDSLRQAVHLLGAHRLGHATRLVEDPSLARYVNDRRIALELCLTSNVQTRAVPSYAAHPARRYFEEGHEVVLCTDNRMMSGVTLTDEYLAAAEHLGFTLEELALVALNGFRAAFLPWAQRLALMRRVRQDIAELLAESA